MLVMGSWVLHQRHPIWFCFIANNSIPILRWWPAIRLTFGGVSAPEPFPTSAIMNPEWNLSRVRKFGIYYVSLGFRVKKGEIRC